MSKVDKLIEDKIQEALFMPIGEVVRELNTLRREVGDRKPLYVEGVSGKHPVQYIRIDEDGDIVIHAGRS